MTNGTNRFRQAGATNTVRRAGISTAAGHAAAARRHCASGALRSRFGTPAADFI
jgi:hypothetical protein